MDLIEKIEDIIYQEIDDISNSGNLSIDCLKVLSELIDIIKDCAEIRMYDSAYPDRYEDDKSYSYGYSRNDGGYSQRRMPIYYNNGNSYRSGRSMNGGYSRRGRGYSYDDSKTHMVEKLNHLMMEATDQKDKDAIQRLIDQMENG